MSINLLGYNPKKHRGIIRFLILLIVFYFLVTIPVLSQGLTSLSGPSFQNNRITTNVPIGGLTSLTTLNKPSENTITTATLTPLFETQATEQDNWQFCNKCQGLFYAGGVSTGVCPAGGNHSLMRSINYVLVYGITPSSSQQDNRRLCNKCQGLFYAGGVSTGICPAGGKHSMTGSKNYVLTYKSKALSLSQIN